MTALGEFPLSSPTGVFSVTLDGEVDLLRQDELQGLVLAFRASDDVSARVDLGAVSFVDSTALGLLSQLRNIALERGGEVVLVDPTPSCLKLLRIVGFDKVFVIERSGPARE